MTLAQARWPEVAAAVLLVPLGSTEQHGPHLPTGTDTRIAAAVAQAAAGPGVLVAPALPYGASGEHETFPGTVSIGLDALRGVLVELGRSACRWAPRLVYVNGHGGNLAALLDAVTRLRAEGRDVAWFGCGIPGGDAHAGRVETSIMLALDPEAVGTAGPGNTAPVARLLPAIRAGSVRDVSPSGVLGDPTGATASEGRAALAVMARRLRADVARWQLDGRGQLDVVDPDRHAQVTMSHARQ